MVCVTQYDEGLAMRCDIEFAVCRCDSCGEPQLSELQGKHILLCVKNRQATNEIDEIIRYIGQVQRALLFVITITSGTC